MIVYYVEHSSKIILSTPHSFLVTTCPEYLICNVQDLQNIKPLRTALLKLKRATFTNMVQLLHNIFTITCTEASYFQNIIGSFTFWITGADILSMSGSRKIHFIYCKCTPLHFKVHKCTNCQFNERGPQANDQCLEFSFDSI